MLPLYLVQLTDQKWVTKKAFSVPLMQKPEVVKGIFRFEAPVSVRVIGSYLFGTAIRPEVRVDLALQLPPVRNCTFFFNLIFTGI